MLLDEQTVMASYEHLVEINDTQQARPHLTRQQIWQGLVARAYTPKLFVPGLDGYTVTEQPTMPGTQLQRTLDYGTFQVHDRVTLQDGHSMITEVAAGPTWPESRLTIIIEEPSAGQFFLRFLYQWQDSGESDALAEMTRNFRENAYYTADLDTVAKIRELALLG